MKADIIIPQCESDPIITSNNYSNNAKVRIKHCIFPYINSILLNKWY